jgi:hypothetical protein
MKVPDIDDLLPDPKQPQPMDPVAENQAFLMTAPVQVFPEQDHRAHIEVHLQFMMSPGFGGNPQVSQIIGPGVQAHIAQHLAYLYGGYMRQMGVPAGMLDPQSGQPMGAGAPPEQIAQMAAKIAQQVGQLPGLPVPPQQPQDQGGQEQLALAQAKLKLQDDAHQQQMRHAEDKHQQAMGQKVQDVTVAGQALVAKHMATLKALADQTELNKAERTDKALHETAKRQLETETAAMRTEMEMAAAQDQHMIDESVRRSDAIVAAQEHQMGQVDRHADFEMRGQERAAKREDAKAARQDKLSKLRESGE